MRSIFIWGSKFNANPVRFFQELFIKKCFESKNILLKYERDKIKNQMDNNGLIEQIHHFKLSQNIRRRSQIETIESVRVRMTLLYSALYSTSS